MEKGDNEESGGKHPERTDSTPAGFFLLGAQSIEPVFRVCPV
jgi:hypothetical protein